MAIERITSVDRLTNIVIYDSKDISESIDKTWIVSGQSPDQKEMITKLPKDKALYVEGGFRVWLREAQVRITKRKTGIKLVLRLRHCSFILSAQNDKGGWSQGSCDDSNNTKKHDKWGGGKNY